MILLVLIYIIIKLTIAIDIRGSYSYSYLNFFGIANGHNLFKLISIAIAIFFTPKSSILMSFPLVNGILAFIISHTLTKYLSTNQCLIQCGFQLTLDLNTCST